MRSDRVGILTSTHRQAVEYRVMHKRLLVSTSIIAGVMFASAVIFWLNTSTNPYHDATLGITTTDTGPAGSNAFRNELIARGLADCLNDPQLDKNNVMEKFCLSFRETEASQSRDSGDWVGHSLISNPYRIHFTYEDAGGAVIASTRGDTVWRDQHRPSQGDLLRIQHRTFATEVHLTEGESASITSTFLASEIPKDFCQLEPLAFSRRPSRG